MSAPMTPDEARGMAQWGGPLYRAKLNRAAAVVRNNRAPHIPTTMRCFVPRKPDDPDPILEALSRSASAGSFTPLLPAGNAVPRADPTGDGSNVVSSFICDE